MATSTSKSSSTGATFPPVMAGLSRPTTKSGSVGSFDPHFPVRPTTDLIADDLNVESRHTGQLIPQTPARDR